MNGKRSKNILNYDLVRSVWVRNLKFSTVVTFKMQIHNINILWNSKNKSTNSLENVLNYILFRFSRHRNLKVKKSVSNKIKSIRQITLFIVN